MIDSDNNLPLLREQYKNFENIWQKDENGTEFVYARDLQLAFGYKAWHNFVKVMQNAKISCKNNSVKEQNHFNEVVKMVTLGSGSSRKIDDVKLTRYACYLIAQNGDPRKHQIAFAQHYFAVQTRRFEKIIERMGNVERLESREKLKESEKEFDRVIYERGVKSEKFGIIKSNGDKEFFGGETTKEMKNKLDIPKSRALQDFTPKTVVLGKALANAITTQNVITNDKKGFQEINNSNISSNKNVRKALIESGIYPEKTQRKTDIREIEKEIKKEDKKLLEQSKNISQTD